MPTRSTRSVSTRRFASPVPASALAVPFSPDGRTLATSHADRAVVLWDVDSRQPIGSPLALPGSPREVYTTARFTPDGRRLFAVHEDGRAFRWDVDPDAWRRHACAVAGGLTPSNGARSCRSRTTSRPAPRADDLDRIAPESRMTSVLPLAGGTRALGLVACGRGGDGDEDRRRRCAAPARTGNDRFSFPPGFPATTASVCDCLGLNEGLENR